jgi:hypothetical protein
VDYSDPHNLPLDAGDGQHAARYRGVATSAALEHGSIAVLRDRSMRIYDINGFG